MNAARPSASSSRNLAAILALISVPIAFMFSQLSGILDGNLLIFTIFMLAPVAGLVASLCARWEYNNLLSEFNPIFITISLHLSWIMGVIITWNFLHPVRDDYDMQMCFSNQRQILMDIMVSTQDNGGNFPPDLAALTIPLKAGCPEWQESYSGLGIGYNTALSNLYMDDNDHPDEMLIIADAKSDKLLYRSDIDDTRHLVETQPKYYWFVRHEPRFFAGFADGHVETMKPGTKLHLSLPAGREPSSR